MKTILSGILALSLLTGGAAFASSKNSSGGKTHSASKRHSNGRHRSSTNRTGSGKTHGNVPSN
jgi:uncharacterized protein YxeA